MAKKRASEVTVQAPVRADGAQRAGEAGGASGGTNRVTRATATGRTAKRRVRAAAVAKPLAPREAGPMPDAVGSLPTTSASRGTLGKPSQRAGAVTGGTSAASLTSSKSSQNSASSTPSQGAQLERSAKQGKQSLERKARADRAGKPKRKAKPGGASKSARGTKATGGTRAGGVRVSDAGMQIEGNEPRAVISAATQRELVTVRRLQFVSLSQLVDPRDVSPVGEFAGEFELETAVPVRGVTKPSWEERLAELPEPVRQLLDRGRGTAGPPLGQDVGRTRDVIGNDERQQIVNTAEYPFSSICSLEMRDGSQSGKFAVGTGCLLGPNLVLTAGHNLYNNDVLRGSVKEVRVYAGRNGRDSYIASEVISDPGRLWVPEGWWKYRDRAQDWGLILLQNDLRQRAGSLGAQAWEADRLYNTSFTVLGYPASGSSAFPPFSQVYEIGKIVSVNMSAGTLQHTIDTTRGQSGAPLLAWDSSRTSEGRMVCVGIHNHGQVSTNQASLITNDVIAQIKPFIRE